MRFLAVILLLFIFEPSHARNRFFNTYPIIQHEHPTLRLEAHQVDLNIVHTNEFKKLIKDMFTTMKRNQGVGLAAPQINISDQIFVMGGFLTGVKKRVMINPEVEFIGERSKNSHEGCLSTKDYGPRNVPRYKKVYVKYYDENGEYQEREFSGFTAIVIQHEFDHLNGKLILDYKNLPKSKYHNYVELPYYL